MKLYSIQGIVKNTKTKNIHNTKFMHIHTLKTVKVTYIVYLFSFPSSVYKELLYIDKAITIFCYNLVSELYIIASIIICLRFTPLYIIVTCTAYVLIALFNYFLENLYF